MLKYFYLLEQPTKFLTTRLTKHIVFSRVAMHFADTHKHLSSHGGI